MTLSGSDLLRLSRHAITAATQAGQLIARYAERAVTVERKAGGDQLASQVVTEVDHLSEALILNELEPTCWRYDLALLTEERDDDRSRLEKGYFWCIDPLDGTLPFIESLPGYAVSIGLVAGDGTPLIGVVYDPTTATLYSAIRGEGALRNGEPWSLSAPATGEGAVLTLVCDRGLVQRADFPQRLQAFQRLAVASGLSGVRTLNDGGAVMNAIWVADNTPACYFKPPKPEAGGGSLWDFAATACLLGELGAVATDFQGAALALNRADSTFMNHRGVIVATDREWLARVQEIIGGL